MNSTLTPATSSSTTRMRSLLGTLLLLAHILTATEAGADGGTASPEAMEEGWRLVTQHRFTEASDYFSRLQSRFPTDEEVALAAAITLLQRQPRWQGNVNRAATVLEEIFATSARPQNASIAGYYRGRLEWLFRSPPDPIAALNWYQRTTNAFPDSFHGELARVQGVLLQLVETRSADEYVSARERLHIDTSTMQHSIPRHTYLLGVAEHGLRHNHVDSMVLNSLLRALDEPAASPITRADLLLQTAEVARRLDQLPIAFQNYTRFLEIVGRDARRDLIEERRRELSGRMENPEDPLP